jgi:hypothetical protein
VTDTASSRRRTARDELAEETAHGDLYLSRLRRAQLELSVVGLLAFGGLVGSLPILFTLAPGLGDVYVLGIPVPALVVAVPIFPLFVGIGFVYQRRAEALDATFRTLIRDE